MLPKTNITYFHNLRYIVFIRKIFSTTNTQSREFSKILLFIHFHVSIMPVRESLSLMDSVLITRSSYLGRDHRCPQERDTKSGEHIRANFSPRCVNSFSYLVKCSNFRCLTRILIPILCIFRFFLCFFPRQKVHPYFSYSFRMFVVTCLTIILTSRISNSIFSGAIFTTASCQRCLCSSLSTGHHCRHQVWITSVDKQCH